MLRTHLRLDSNFDDSASESEDVTDDKEDIPAIYELHPVCPAHFTVQSIPKEPHELLINTQ